VTSVTQATTANVSATTSDWRGDEVDVLRPVNTVVMVGDDVVLPCSSRASNDARWDFYREGMRQPINVYNGNHFHDDTGRRMNLDVDSCRLKTCNLSITSVKLEDVGFYVCFESSRPERRAASLIVLGSTLLSFIPN